jgi:hypothetical protein
VEKTTFEELHDLYSSTNIIRVIKTRRIRWAGRVEPMEGEEKCLQVVGGEVWERDHLEDLDVDRRIILKRIFKKWYGGGN